MGLRFRRSVTLFKGVKLNFGKTGVSVTTGVKGFHKTYNLNTGKTTTSIGIPGTGISYVTTSGGRSNSSQRQQSSQRTLPEATPRYAEYEDVSRRDNSEELNLLPQDNVPENAFYLSDNECSEIEDKKAVFSSEQLTSIHYLADKQVDWTEILIQDEPPSDCEDKKFWKYCHEKAYKVLNGDIDTYLEIIKDVCPLDDLLDYGFNFECGTDNSNIMFVEFETKPDEIMPSKDSMEIERYNDLLQDYICSCSIRVARDIFALLPVSHVIVHAVLDKNTVLSVDFERRIFNKIKFANTDASDLVEEFRHNMNFDSQTGFKPVAQLES